ncbi:clavesin-1 [Nilaparvata lugens]|uniref:clavesin-1 n=1 Tax=Nilaparvata lugens TaxID=108931 RepID=UPI00193D9877|nr:clavesin-1 [Nilaparvata lugens]
MGEMKYKCPLSIESVEIAKEELREDETTREQALEILRSWIERNPRIENCRMDASFLLRFLRFKKFSVPMAQEALERYLLLRQCYEYSFRNLDIQQPNMSELFDKGYLFAAPGRDKKGRRVIIARPGVFDPHKFRNIDMCRIHGVVYETLMEDEESQVRGFVHFNDGVGVSFPHLTLFTPKECVRIVKNGEIYSAVEEAHEHIDKKMLPKEYGGEMPMAEMIDLFRKELEASRGLLLSHDEELKVREDMFSESAKCGAVSALKNGGNCNPHQDILAGSFRKLEVD